MTPKEQALDIIHNSPYFAYHKDIRMDKSSWKEIEDIIFKYGLRYTLHSDGFYHLSGDQPSLKVEAILRDREQLSSEQ